MREPILPVEEHERIAQAIRAAESRTTGEIYCVLARRSDSYFFPSAFMAAAAIMVAMAIAGFALDRSWLDPPHAILPLAGLAALATAGLVLWLAPGLRIRMVPRWLRYQRASTNAVSQFLSHNIHGTEHRTGVLIFVSIEERYAEIVADAGVNGVVDQQAWNGIVAALAARAAEARFCEGFVEAIEAAGGLLAEHFPRNGSVPANELADRLVEI